METFSTTPIERVQHISKNEFIDNYYKPQRPVLIEGITKNWPAYHKWNLNYIQDRAGDQIVPLYDSKPTTGRQNSAAPATEMRLDDYLELLKTKPTDLRIFFYNILDSMPELAHDFEFPNLGLKFFKKLPVLFFGGKSSKVFAHYDMDLADLVHVHFHGTKSITLFSQEQTKYLYRVPFSVHNLETIDMDNPDFEKYPALRHLEGIEVSMKHGDALYMPSGYWHYIKYLDGGFSITLRALPTKPLKLLNTLYNVFFMRNFENIMRKTLGQKWVDYKERRMIKKTNKKFGPA
jgi:cupin-like protein